MGRFLHVGCGVSRKTETTAGFNQPHWQEFRLDLNPAVQPDFLGSMLDMSSVPDASMDAIFSSHSLEHVYLHQVPLALKEFLRVLKPEGFAVIYCPDLQSVCELVAQDALLQPAYTSPAGPITPLDILYGYQRAVAEGIPFMEHKCGFTRSTLTRILLESGFAQVAIKQRGYAPCFDLCALACKSVLSEQTMALLMQEHLPFA